jgi:hypothetical protein
VRFSDWFTPVRGVADDRDPRCSDWYIPRYVLQGFSTDYLVELRGLSVLLRIAVHMLGN